MSESEQVMQFANDIDKIVDRARSEYELTFASIVGTLMMKAHLLCDEASERDEEV